MTSLNRQGFLNEGNTFHIFFQSLPVYASLQPYTKRTCIVLMLCIAYLFIYYAISSRYFLVEKAKDANIVGIIAGTLGVGMSYSIFYDYDQIF